VRVGLDLVEPPVAGALKRLRRAPAASENGGSVDSRAVDERTPLECYRHLQMLDGTFRWVVEPGTFRVLIGASSKDIRLRGEFAVR